MLQKRACNLQAHTHAGTSDIAAYITALEPRILAQPIERVRLASLSCFEPRNLQLPTSRVATSSNYVESATNCHRSRRRPLAGSAT